MQDKSWIVVKEAYKGKKSDHYPENLRINVQMSESTDSYDR